MHLRPIRRLTGEGVKHAVKLEKLGLGVNEDCADCGAGESFDVRFVVVVRSIE